MTEKLTRFHDHYKVNYAEEWDFFPCPKNQLRISEQYHAEDSQNITAGVRLLQCSGWWETDISLGTTAAVLPNSPTVGTPPTPVTATSILVDCHPHLILGAIRMLMMDVPSPTTEGESVELICSYKLDEDKLYSVKWYKDDVEFYRYVPNDWPPGQFLPLQGVRVDLSKSGSQSVYLREVDLNSAGTYRCEVSAEAPEFQTVEAEREMKVFVLPTDGPKITGGQSKYRIGDTVSVNCTSSKSKPAATLRWYINDEQATPENELEHSTTLHADGLETSSLSLRFIVSELHFRGGNMKLKCTATISRIYTMSNEELVFGTGLRQQTSGLHITENMSHVQSCSVRIRSVQWLYNILFICILASGLTEAIPGKESLG